jgi:hypothetical protein
MSAQIIQFPVRYRPDEPRAVVCVMSCGEYGEALVVADGHGWLHACWRDAVNDAVAYAVTYGPASIQIEGDGHA